MEHILGSLASIDELAEAAAPGVPAQQLRVLMQFSHNESLLAALGASKEVSTALLIVACSQGCQALSLHSLSAEQHNVASFWSSDQRSSAVAGCEVAKYVQLYGAPEVAMRPYNPPVRGSL